MKIPRKEGNFILDLIQFRNMKDLQEYQKSVIEERFSLEGRIAEENRKKSKWSLAGYCECCHKDARFLIDWNYSDGVLPNYRERLLCEWCGLNSRQRFVASYVRDALREKRKTAAIYVYEQVTGFYDYLRNHTNYGAITGSEYLGYNRKPRSFVGGIRHEDALDLSFKDHSFDVVISNDVYEHVPDILSAFSEAFRILRTGGKLVFAIPFHTTEKKTRQRALMKEGEVLYLLPEQYHGNPISEKGSLVFYDFGWDILDMLKEAEFRDAYMLGYYSYFLGYLGYGLQFIFVAEK